MARRATPRSAEAALREHALSYPEASEEFPWGERVIKVRGKVFAFLGRPGEGLSVEGRSVPVIVQRDGFDDTHRQVRFWR